MTLLNPDLSGPQMTALQDNTSYLVYTYEDLPAAGAINLAFSGQPSLDTASSAGESAAKPAAPGFNWAIGIGGGVLGLAMIAVGVWQWRKSRDNEAEEDGNLQLLGEKRDGDSLDEIIAEIAQLDEAHEREEISEEEHRQRRAALRQQARTWLSKMDK